MNFVQIGQEIGGATEQLAHAEFTLREAREFYNETVTRIKAESDYVILGPNNAARDIAMDAIILQRTETQRVDIAEAEKDVARAKTALEALIAERRGMEWQCRADMVAAMRQSGHTGNVTDNRVWDAEADRKFVETFENAPFDDGLGVPPPPSQGSVPAPAPGISDTELLFGVGALPH